MNEKINKLESTNDAENSITKNKKRLDKRLKRAALLAGVAAVIGGLGTSCAPSTESGSIGSSEKSILIQVFSEKKFVDRDISNLTEIKTHELGFLIVRIKIDYDSAEFYFANGHIERKHIHLDIISVSDDRSGKDVKYMYATFFKDSKVVQEGYIKIR